MDIKDFNYQIHASEGDTRANFNPSDSDEQAASPRYYGMTDLNGRYIIMRETNSSGLKTYRVAYGRSGYTTAWTNRASLDYYRWEELRGIL